MIKGCKKFFINQVFDENIRRLHQGKMFFGQKNFKKFAEKLFSLMKTSYIFVENLVNKKLLLAAFYHLTYQPDSKDLIFASIYFLVTCLSFQGRCAGEGRECLSVPPPGGAGAPAPRPPQGPFGCPFHRLLAHPRQEHWQGESTVVALIGMNIKGPTARVFCTAISVFFV